MNQAVLNAIALDAVRTFGVDVDHDELTFTILLAYGFAVGWYSQVSGTVH